MVKRGLYIAFVVIAVLMVAGIVAAERLGVRSIRYDDIVTAGDEAVFYVSVINQGDHDADDVHVEVMSPDGLDLFAGDGMDRLHDGDAASFVMPAYVPMGTAPGDYYVRFTIGDKDDERHVYRIITIE
jgi:uncharacterized membrane protein